MIAIVSACRACFIFIGESDRRQRFQCRVRRDERDPTADGLSDRIR